MIWWVDGRIVGAGEPAIRPDDRGFTLGDGVFETMRLHRGRPHRLEAHLARLRNGASLIGLPPQPDDAALRAALDQAIAASGEDEGVVRLTVTRGPSARGLDIDPAARPTVVVAVAAGLPPDGPVRLRIARQVRRDGASVTSRIKALGGYLDNILARREAQTAGADDAVLLNTSGRVASASAANLFAFRNGRLVTPRIEDGILPGTLRALILETGAAETARLEVEDLLSAEAVLLTNSLGIRMAVAIEHRSLDPDRARRALADLRAALLPQVPFL